MPHSLLCRLMVFAAIFLPWASEARAQDKEPERKVREASLAAKDLAALQAFRALVASRSYAIPENQLAPLVEEYLRKSQTEVPKRPPTVGDLQNSLDIDFRMWYGDLLAKATSGLDPDEKLGLKDRLQTYLEKHPSLQSAAEGNFARYVKKDLPGALDQVIESMVTRQVVELERALTDLLAGGKPTVAQIEDAYQNDRQPQVADALRRSILRELDTDLRECLLVGAFETLNTHVQQIVSDGVRQVEEQVSTLGVSPESYTSQGIEAELTARLDEVADRQAERRQSSPQSGPYGVFPLAAAAVTAESAKHFDEKVASAGNRVRDKVVGRTLKIPHEHEEAIQTQIRSNLSGHHEPKASEVLLDPVVNTMIGANRQWITDTLKKDAASKPSLFDEGKSIESLDKEVDPVLAKEGTKSHSSWLALRAVLKKEYVETLLPRVRAEIADKQSWQYSPSLAGGTWLPSEVQIVSFSGRPRQDDLLKLNVWKVVPPAATTDVLAEVWQLWLSNAQKAIGKGQDAMRQQNSLVGANEGHMKNRILNESTKTVEEWVAEYTATVMEQWQGKTDSAARAYPELFFATKSDIAGIVARLLLQVEEEKEKAEAMRLAEEQRKRDEEEARKAREQMRQPVEEPESQIDQPKEREPSVPTEPSPGGDSATPLDGNRNEPPPSSNGDLHSVDEEAAVLAAQNDIVDRLMPEMTAAIRSALETKGRLDQEFWNDMYTSRTTLQWKRNTLARNYPVLLPAVRERIEGLVAQFLRPMQTTIEDVVRAYQESMVEEHRIGSNSKESIIQLIEMDENPTYDQYKGMFVERVLEQWQSDNSPTILSLRRVYPDLLKSVERLISGIVADAIITKGPPNETPEPDEPELVAEESEAIAQSGEDEDLPKGGDGFGEGDSPYGFRFKFYRLGFWTMVFLLLTMAACWYWNVRYLRMYIAARRHMSEEDEPSRTERFRTVP